MSALIFAELMPLFISLFVVGPGACAFVIVGSAASFCRQSAKVSSSTPSASAAAASMIRRTAHSLSLSHGQQFHVADLVKRVPQCIPGCVVRPRNSDFPKVGYLPSGVRQLLAPPVEEH